MRWQQVASWLMPGAMEEDEGFRQEILSASHRGARVVAAVEAALAVLAITGLLPRIPALALAALATATFGATSIQAAYPYGRLLAGLSCIAAAVIPLRAIPAGADVDYALAAATLLILVAAAVLPLRPVDGLGMGAIVSIAGIGGGHELFLAMLTLAACCITTTLYGQRRNSYGLYLGMLKMTAELRQLESQAMRAESSDTMVRLTAALAHELSSPLGALSSGIDMLFSLRDRPKPESEAAASRLVDVQADLRRSTRESLERLRKTVNRIQRMTNYDEAATQQANLNELVNEAVGLVKPTSPEGTRFELDLQPIPNVTCRPQRLLAVLCSVLANSVQALNGEGRITVSTAVRDSVLELKIEDNGRGIPAEHMAHIFDPRFQVAEGRVSTGNWSLFTSRQYMKEHSGDIRIQSTEGRGTSVCLTLPSTS